MDILSWEVHPIFDHSECIKHEDSSNVSDWIQSLWIQRFCDFKPYNYGWITHLHHNSMGIRKKILYTVKKNSPLYFWIFAKTQRNEIHLIPFDSIRMECFESEATSVFGGQPLAMEFFSIWWISEKPFFQPCPRDRVSDRVRERVMRAKCLPNFKY